MKKLILLAIALVTAVACNSEKPNDKPIPPVPVGDPTINLTRIEGKRALADTVHVIIGNYNGDVEFSSKNPNFYFELDNETEPGIIILNSLTFGSTDVYVKCGGKTFTIPAKFDQFITEPFYSKPLIPFGKTVDEIIALEVARGNDDTPIKGFTKDKKFYTVNIPVKAKNKYTMAEKFTYTFPVTNETQIGVCTQSSILSTYGTNQQAENSSIMAWGETTELHYYGGIDETYNMDYAVDRDLKYVTIYQAGQPADGNWSYQGHYIEYTPVAGTPSKAIEGLKFELNEASQFTSISDIKKVF